MDKKFRLTDKMKMVSGRKVYQIEAIRSFGEIKSGDLGGWLEDENSLSQEGETWVFRAGVVFKRAIIAGGTIRGGMIRGGTISGGTISGGTISGGMILGGRIVGGTIRGGTILDGTIWGGTIWGGTIRGGTIWGGTIWGGTIRGGTISGGMILGGTVVTKTVVAILGIRWGVTITDKHITIGCQTHTFAFWKKATNETIEKMELGALPWWEENRSWILKLAEGHEHNDQEPRN